MKHLLKIDIFELIKEYPKIYEFVLNDEADDIDLQFLEAIKDYKNSKNVEEFNNSLSTLRKKYPKHESSITRLAFHIWFNQTL
jgi:hypothetical protein